MNEEPASRISRSQILSENVYHQMIVSTMVLSTEEERYAFVGNVQVHSEYNVYRSSKWATVEVLFQMQEQYDWHRALYRNL